MSLFVIKEKDAKKVFSLNKDEIIIGRGAYLAVADKRVSRKHGTIKSTDEGIELKSTHVNPCFYTRRAEPEKWMKLDKEETVVLQCGDTFSLLPKQYIYEVIEKEGSDGNEPNLSTKEKESRGDVNENDQKHKNLNDSKTEKLSDQSNISITSNENDVKVSISNKDQSETESEKQPKIYKKEFPVKGSQVKAISSPPESRKRQSLNSTYEDEDGKVIALPSNKKRKLPDWMTKKSQVSGKKPEASEISGKTPKSTTAKKATPKSGRVKNLPKLNFSSDSESAGKISSSENHKIDERVEVQSENLNKAGTSSEGEEVEMVDESVETTKYKDDDADKEEMSEAEVGAQSSEKRDLIDSPLKSTPKDDVTASVPSRSPCAYGASCYRQNPQHRAEFSHPGDTDYVALRESDDESSRPECPYGTSCYRKNPLHKKQFSHTRRVAPKRAAKIRAARKANDESSEDDYDLNDSFINDDSDDDLDAGASEEEDSDWNPSQGTQSKGGATRGRRNKTATNYKETDSEDSEEDEDLDELVSDAKNFSRNRKMWKK